MSSLTLKNVPEELLEELRAVAVQERRSLNQQALKLLIEGLRSRHREGPPDHRVGIQLEAWRELAGQWRSSDEHSEQEIQRIYERRSRGRKVSW